MFVAVGLGADRVHLGAELLERARSECRERPVRAVDADPQAARGRCRTSRHVREIRAARVGELVRPRRRPARRTSSRASISSSCSSTSLPPPRNNFTPLYSGGLCEADSTTPRSSARNATAGVGSTPPRTAVPPAEAMPRATACSSSGPEPRVSRPTRTRPPPAHSVAAFPIRSTRSAVRSAPTTPRTPSVPKYRRATAGDTLAASRTGAPCAPCAGRPSCARRCERRASGSPGA